MDSESVICGSGAISATEVGLSPLGELSTGGNMALKDNGNGTFSIVRERVWEKQKPLDRAEIYGLAIQAGFMLSTQYGQAEDKLMPVTDGDTLVALVRAIEERLGIK